MEAMIGLLILLPLFLLLHMWIEAHKNKITYTKLTFSNYPKSLPETRIFFISDVHHREISPKIVKKIKGKVDVIIIGGDLAEKGVPFSKIEKNIKALTAVAPTYFVWGNNDYEVNHLKLEALLKGEGVTLLVNSSTIIKDQIYLIGVDDYGHRFDNLEEALYGCEGFQILISHNPDIKKKIRENHQIDLILSGHTHGGQIRLFGWGITEKAGLLRLKKNLYMLVSNGYGTTRLPLRLGAPAEVHVVTIGSPLNGEV